MSASIPSPRATDSPNPTTPAYPDDIQWVTVYLVIHMLSPGSFWYAYLLWIVIGCIFSLFIVLHWTRPRGGYIGTYWRKWAVRRRTWRGAHAIASATRKGRRPQLTSLHSNGQILTLVGLCIGAVLLCFVGPDYAARPASTIFRRFSISRTSSAYDITPFLSLQPQYQISKAWWTSSNRVGVIAFALLPLCVLLALKAPPFAIFAISFTTQIHFDKLAWLHRWAGRLIWLLSTLHVLLWSVQLSIDRRAETGQVAYTYVWQYPKFIYGWTAFILMTALIGLSSSPIRKRYYELFYSLHLLLVPATIIMAALHHPPVWWWCWIALGLWIGERLWRSVWWLHLNGILGHPDVRNTESLPQRSPDNAKQPDQIPHEPESYPPTPKSSSPFITDAFDNSGLLSLPVGRYTPPPGFAHAELLSGATIRLTFVPSGFVSWAPGQHFSVNIPSISRLTSHPFTVASVCDEQASSDTGRAMVFLIRTKSGWTRNLWDRVLAMMNNNESHVASETIPSPTLFPKAGVIMKMYIDGPFGSAIRAPWRDYSTVLVIVGGSGVSFGMSVLQFVCLCLAGRDGRFLGGHAGGCGSRRFKTRRVRFLWVIREYSHIQWCASALRRCMIMMPSPSLDIDIFVTNPTPSLPQGISEPPSPVDDNRPLALADVPLPVFMAKRSSRGSVESVGRRSLNYIDPNPVVTHFGDDDSECRDTGLQEIYTLYLTNFEGDTDMPLPGEAALSKRIRSDGKLLRARSRRATQEGDSGDSGSHYALRLEGSTHKGAPSTERLLTPTWRSMAQHSDEQLLNQGTSRRGIIDSPLSSSPHLPGHFTPQSEQEMGKTLQIEVDPSEMDDMSYVSEHTRLGKPKLDQILEDEVQSARGPVIVATCGPTSLDAMIRKAVAKQLNPARIRSGDLRGFIDLVSENFDY